MITAITRKITFASAIFFSSFFIFENLIDLAEWFFLEEESPLNNEYKDLWQVFSDLLLPYLLAGLATIRYLKRAFSIENLTKLFKRSLFWWMFSAFFAIAGLIFKYL
jgi:hypothetical protein